MTIAANRFDGQELQLQLLRAGPDPKEFAKRSVAAGQHDRGVIQRRHEPAISFLSIWQVGRMLPMLVSGTEG